MLLHLVRTQAACLIDQIMVEWHPIAHHRPELQRYMAMAAPLRAQKATESPSASGVAAFVNVSSALRAALEHALNSSSSSHDASDCRTRLEVLDDETFKTDGAPLPEKMICAPVPALLG